MQRQLEGTRAELDQARKVVPKQAPPPPRLKAVKEEEEFVDESPTAARVTTPFLNLLMPLTPIFGGLLMRKVQRWSMSLRTMHQRGA
jgi:hypothetical protein